MSEHPRSAIACVVDGDEERALAGVVEELDVVDHNKRRIAAGCGTQQVRAPAACVAPHVDDALRQRTLRELAYANQRFGVPAGDEVIE